ncbi:MAG: fibronectin type III domain-containing protein [Elusimicrobiota bacterium]
MDALRRLRRAADKAVRRAVVWAPLMAAFLGGAIPARATPTAQLNINVTIQGIGNITDLTAVPGTSTGTVGLSWTEPYRSAGVAPFSYDVRVSTVGQIANDAVYSTTSVLAVFSPSVPPAPGSSSGGGAAGFVVAGLNQGVTYYFAIREKDSTTYNGSWLRTTVPARNVNNFAVATSTTVTAPAGGVISTVMISSITATWAVAPGATNYNLVASTKSANPPLLIAASSATLTASTGTVSGLVPNTTYFLFVSACNTGCSAYTALGSSLTLAAPAVSLSTNAISTGTVALIWGANGDPAGTLYQVSESTDGVAFSTVAASTQTALTVGGLNGGTSYYFQVIATNFAGLPAAPSNMISVLTPSGPPAAPASVAVLSVSTASVTAAWSVVPGATDYVLLASTSSANPPLLIAGSSTTLSSTGTVSGLAPNTTYFLFAAACDANCSAYTASGSTITLAAPVVALSTQAISSATVSLAWNPNGDPLGTFNLVQLSTDGITFATVNTSTSAGISLAGLTGATSYYFQVIAVNGAGIAAAPSNVLLVVTPSGPTPSAPAGVAASGGLLNAVVTWNPLPLAQQGVGLLYYVLQRSANASFGFVAIATTTGTSYTDQPLAAGATVFYRLIARDQALTNSAPSAVASAVPYAERPMEPLGVTVVPSSTTVTISWSPTTRFSDGSRFLSTGTPTGDELQGYQVYRSTDLCSPNYVQLSTYAISVNSLTDTTGGLNYYYRLLSFNSVGASTNVVTLSSLAERNYLLDDCVSDLVMDDQSATTLNGSVNGMGDIRLLRSRRPQDVGNGIYQSAEFRAYLNGATLLSNYVLPKPARVVLHFDTLNGKPTPSTAAANGVSPLASALLTGGGATVDDLGVYWNNGVEFKKMYGRIDPVAQTVSVQTPNLGVYQIRALARSAGVVFDLSNLSSRVITPNGDGLNDVAIFTYDPGPNNVVPEGKIFDLRGAFVSDMAPGLVPNTLTWNGFMSGLPVHSGVYMYRITGGGKTFSGTIVVAR